LDSGEPFSGKVPFFVICIFLARRYIRYTSPAQAESPHTFLGIIRRIDLPGCILLASWIGFALTAVSLVTNSTTGSPTWSCPEVIGLFVASGVVFLFFLVWELKIVEYPVVPVEILNRRTPIAVAINNFVLSVVTFALVRISSHDSSLRSISLTRAVDVLGPPLFYTTVHLMTPASAGRHLTTVPPVGMLASFSSGYYVRLTGKYYSLVHRRHGRDSIFNSVVHLDRSDGRVSRPASLNDGPAEEE